MRIMTSNIWGDFFNNPAELRKDNLYKVYQKYHPDVIGFQEAVAGWYDVDLFWKLGEAYHLIGTDCCHNTNSTPMAVKKNYTVIADGHEQLENTPDWSKSITWAVAEKADERFAVCNTHFWWMRGNEPEQLRKAKNVFDYTWEDHCALRSQNAKQLAQLMEYLHKRYSVPVFAFGDMNATVSEGIFDVYAEHGIKKLYDLAEEKDTACSVHKDPVRGDDGLFHGEKATGESVSELRKILGLPDAEGADGAFSSIDHIVALGEHFNVPRYCVAEDQEALDSSDHSPVYADIEWQK